MQKTRQRKLAGFFYTASSPGHHLARAEHTVLTIWLDICDAHHISHRFWAIMFCVHCLLAAIALRKKKLAATLLHLSS